MKIVRLVLLLSLVGVPAACNGGSVTGPTASPATSVPSFGGGSTPDSIKATDGQGPAIGSGT